MGLNGSLSGITFGGLSSGIDTEGIISRLVQVEGLPAARMKARQQEITNRQSAFAQLRTRLGSLARAAGALNSEAAFNPVSATSSNTATATLAATGDAPAGAFNLSVTRLAQAHKVGTTARPNVTDALGSTGAFVVNGKTVTVEATDSLRTLAAKVNALGAGVTASLIDGGTGAAYLTLASNATGATNRLQVADVSGGVLGSLGLLTGAATVRDAITNGARSASFTANTTPLQTLLGGTGTGAQNVQIAGVTVTVDLATDSLQAVADRINTAAIPGVSATVRSETVDGKTGYRLEIDGASTPSFTDAGGTLAALGVLQQSFGNSLVTAQDASYALDGVALTSASNTVTGAIPGATLTLLKANATTPETSTLTLTKDLNAVKTKVKGLSDAFNEVIDLVRQGSQFDAKSFDSGPFFGDPLVRQIEDATTSLLFTDVEGLTGSYKNLASLGFALDKEGKLTVDDAVLTKALTEAPGSVAALFRTAGSSSSSALGFVSATDKAKPSGTAGYAVNVTTLATKQSFIAGTAPLSANPSAERLTFSGSLFGAGYSLDLEVGSTLASTIAKISGDSRLKELLVASDDAGRLRLDSKRFGTPGNFTVVSNFTSSTSNSGIGVGGEGTTVAGVDIAGTIHGETASGSGQFLTGSSGNANTDGLQVQYSGASTGAVGTLVVTKGVGTKVNDLMGSFTDSVNGLLTEADKAMKAQVDDLQTSIDSLQERLKSRQQELRQRFARMEEAISRAQSQGSRLAALAQQASR